MVQFPALTHATECGVADSLVVMALCGNERRAPICHAPLTSLTMNGKRSEVVEYWPRARHAPSAGQDNPSIVTPFDPTYPAGGVTDTGACQAPLVSYVMTPEALLFPAT